MGYQVEAPALSFPWMLLVFYIFLLQPVPSATSMPSVITIGAVLSSPAHEEMFHRAVEGINQSPGHLPPGISLNATSIPMNDNPIVAAQSVCIDLIPKKIYVAIASHPPHSDLSPLSVSFTCGFYKIPVLGISARHSTFSDKKVHTAFMRTVPPYSEQCEVWVHMMKSFEFNLVIFIHSSDQEGRAMLSRFQSQAETKDIEIEKNVQYTAGQQNFAECLSVLQNLSSRVVLLYARVEDAARIYEDAARLNLTGAGYAWFVTEQALEPLNTPTGVVALKLENTNEDAHIQDGLRVISQAITKMEADNINITEAPSQCDDGSNKWESGPDILQYMRAQHFENGQTGVVQFDSSGDRLNAEYQVVNVQKDQVKIVGSFGGKDQKLVFNKDAIVWPGGLTQKPKGIKISTHLKVVTIVALPFVYAEPMSSGQCSQNNGHKENKIPCLKPNYTEGTEEEFCCYGYCIDLLVQLANTVNFTYDLHLVADSQYGSFERRNGSSKKTWNGMVGELQNGQADLIVAPMTINPERAEYMDFSKPFKYQGITILVKKTAKDSSLASFLQPFQDTLWILVGLSVHVVALVLYLLDRFSPFGRFKLAKSEDTEEDALNLSSAMWFAWGVLLNSGIGEGTPRSFSARVLGMVWAGFAMIIVASYTANLAAFLVLDRPEASISGIDDARLRNPQEKFKYATVKNSAVAMYFKRQVELSTMYRTMESRNYPSAKEAIQDVRIGELHAFIWDSSRLEYEAATDCDLVTPGQLFGRSGYGIGLHKNSPWTEDVSLAILSFHESGEMERLDGKWILIKYTKCPEKDTSPATLGLTNMAGVFMMVAGGIVTGIFLIFIEIAYKRHRGLKEKELELAKTAADRWRGNIEKRKLLRQSREMLRNQKLALSNGPQETKNTAPYAATGAARGKPGEEWNHGHSFPAAPAAFQHRPGAARGLPARRYQYEV